MMSNIAKKFITTPYFAVVGASVAREKFGNKVLRWYSILYAGIYRHILIFLHDI